MPGLERRFGKYAIRNLSMVLIIFYAVGYVLNLLRPDFMTLLTLNPHLVLQGQIWRLVTWLLIPPATGNLFFLLIMLYFYYSIGTILERTWGTWRYNVYIFSGLLFTIIGAFLSYGIALVSGPENAAAVAAIGAYFYSTYYVNLSLFLAYAVTYPEAQVLLMFFIPVKVKWLGIIYAAIVVLDALRLPFFGKISIVASLLNFLLFFFRSRRGLRPGEILRRAEFQAKSTAARMRQQSTLHRCTVCGRTEKDDPTLEFRYCSKCAGNREYCMEHLFTHVHIGQE